jgi:hypothetical protein
LFDFKEIPRREFEEPQEAVAESATFSTLYANLKAVPTWYVRGGERKTDRQN